MLYYGAADTCVGLAFGYVDEIVQYIKDNSVLNPDDGVAFGSFNVYTYRDEHPELWEKFGDNLRGYYLWACGIPQ